MPLLSKKRRIAILLIPAGFLTLRLLTSSTAAHALFGSFFILASSYLIGKSFCYRVRRESRWQLGILLYISVLAIAGSCAFYLYDLSRTTLYILTILLLAFTFYASLRTLRSRDTEYETATDAERMRLWQVPLHLSYIAVCAAMLIIITQSAITQSAVSPWPHLPTTVFVLFFLAGCLLATLSLSNSAVGSFHYALLILVAIGVTTLLFPLGLGFDQFIHQANERMLLADGSISPKPLYYVGYYVVTVWLSWFLSMPIAIVDSLITLALAAIIVPATFFACFRVLASSRSQATFAPLVLLLIPYSDLVQSTPQALGFVWSIGLSMLILMNCVHRIIPWAVIIIIALASLSFHPIIGLPMLFFAIGVLLYNSPNVSSAIKKYILIALFALCITAVPASLLIASSVSPEFAITMRQPAWNRLLEIVPALHRYISLEDAIYSFGSARTFILIAFAFLGTWHLRKYFSMRTVAVPLTVAAAVFGSSILVRLFFAFDFATSSEQGIFTDRLLSLSMYILLPLSTVGAIGILQGVLRSHTALKRAWVLFVAAAMTMSWYLSYPRFDTREQSRGHTASADDLAAVQWIHADAGSNDYIVLANQSVSGLAVGEYGFHRYFNGVFYYPLPTNAELYKIFLSSMDPRESAGETIKRARALAQVERIYIILDSYWDDAAKVDASLSQYSARRINLGTTTIFTFE